MANLVHAYFLVHDAGTLHLCNHHQHLGCARNVKECEKLMQKKRPPCMMDMTEHQHPCIWRRSHRPFQGWLLPAQPRRTKCPKRSSKKLFCAAQPPSWVCSTTIMHHPRMNGTQCTDNSIGRQRRRTPNKRLFTSPVKPSELLASSEDACTNCQACRYDLYDTYLE